MTAAYRGGPKANELKDVLASPILMAAWLESDVPPADEAVLPLGRRFGPPWIPGTMATMELAQ